MTTPSGDHLVGRTVAHYEVLARVGGGGMGVVYKARDTRLGRTVALKFLPPQWSHDEDAKERFIREAQAASATDHRNICTIHDIATADDGQLFIVMAYYEGQTLKQRIEAGPLPIDEALDIATQIADGLTRAHEQGVVHRDVKPGNLILAEDGVRILDFGLATFVEAAQLTVIGSTLGTAAYMSPEQVRGEAADARTDVWAVGVILYQMLTGHVPFRGAYAEAIGHAIRNETPAPIRVERPELPEEVEFLVFRALHKDAGVRFANGRELARALRQVRGLTLPIDLRTQEVVTPAGASLPARRRRSRTPIWVTVAAILLPIVGGAAWMMRPPVRPTVVILPISNQTGEEELAPYQRALTLAMIDALSSSPVVRPVPWTRALQALRRFDRELASIPAAGAVTGLQGSQIVVVPTLLYDDQRWRVRIDIRDGTSTRTLQTYESTPRVSALIKETAYALAFDAVTLVEAHFGRRNPRLWFRRSARPRALASLDAMKAFESGVSLYDEQEYAPAHAAFVEAARLDPASALAQTWRSRAAMVMRDRPTASAAATAAERLLGSDVPSAQRLFAEAVIAEARADDATAEARLRALIAEVPDEPAWLLELAMLVDRRADALESWSAAVAQYRDALVVDRGLIRPHLELCRLYNRLQEGPAAIREGRAALEAYRRIEWHGGEALAMFCLVDTLRGGEAPEVAEAADLANRAHAVLSQLGFSYNLPRAVYYQGLAVAEQDNLEGAIQLWNSALTSAETAGNRPLQPIILNNLGVANNRLGNPALSAEQLSRSAALFEATGEGRRAARLQYNSAVLRINYSVNDQAALRDVDNALAVMRRQGDSDFEVGAVQIRALFFKQIGEFEQAEREINRALELARKSGLEPRVVSVTLAKARLQWHRSQYADALSTVASLESPTWRPSTEARIIEGRALTRLGDFDAARGLLDAAKADLDRRDDAGVRPFLHVALGELYYQAGRLREARAEFERVARLWRDEFAEEAVVESAAFLALLDVLEQRNADGLTRLMAAVDHARTTRRAPLEARLRVLMAGAYVAASKPGEANQVLDGMASLASRLGGDGLAQMHYWRGRAAADTRQAGAEYEAARNVLKQFAAGMPERYRTMLTRRADLRDI